VCKKGWPVLRLFGFLVLAAVGIGGFLTLDYRTSRQAALDEGAEDLTFQAYLDGVPERIARATGSSGSAGMPTVLADMLPHPPEGWTVRPAVTDDLAGFLPKGGQKADADAIDLVGSVLATEAASGGEVVILAYEQGERRVLVQAIRHPDHLFIGLKTIDQRYDLRMAAADPRRIPFMTVRGLDVSERFLGEGMRGRLFMADVGAQIQLRILASRRIKDAELLPFFETLHVQALNAAVVDQKPGLGEIGVIVLASALDEAGREAYAADHEARQIELAAWVEADHLAARARAEAAEPADIVEDPYAEKTPIAGFVVECKKGDGGTKRCSVDGAD
jgi:hypothetical protein